MRRRDRSWRRSVSEAATLAVAAVALLGCTQTMRVQMGETFSVGQFRLRVQSVTAEQRRNYKGVRLDVEIRLSCDGGTRFDRMDFAEALTRKGRVYFRAEGGWRERLYLSASGEDARALVTHAYPAAHSRGYVLSLDNPYGRPEQIEVDLGR